MDQRRRETRIASEQSVLVTVLEGPQERYPAIVRNASGKGLAIAMAAAISPGTALKIECEDSILLGEVVYSRPLPEGHLIGVELDQVLHGLRELGNALREFDDPAFRTSSDSHLEEKRTPESQPTPRTAR